MSVPAQVVLAEAYRREALEQRGLLAQVVEPERGHLSALVAAQAVDPDEPLGVAERQLGRQEAPHEPEHRGVGSDAEPEYPHEHRYRGPLTCVRVT